MAWTDGQLINNEYTIVKELGKGGFGVTYEAIDQKGRRVVIKTLNDDVQKRPDFDEFQQEFINEALRLAKCSHPHIAEVHKVIQQKGKNLWCMVMDYIDGGDLAKQLGKKGILSESDALLYIRQIGEALIVVHKQGLLHRDIKPSNIMLRSRTKAAVLIDFGIAREFTPDQVQTHTEFHTPGYAPLEQYYRYEARGAYTDIYALAATLYTLLTGAVPLPALDRSKQDLLHSPKRLNSQISDTTNQAILKGMAVKSSDRPQSMEAWLKMLEMVKNSPSLDPTIPVTPRPKPPDPKPDIGKREFLRNLGLGVGALASVVLWNWFFKNNSSNPSTTVDEIPTFVFATFTQDLGNGVMLDMIAVEGGEFMMGSNAGDKDELPQHRVKVPNFHIGKFEITQKQYAAIMGSNPSYFKGDENRPVENVSWNDAQDFCKRLSVITGKKYRLPSEAEWEYAAKGGKNGKGYTYAGSNNLDEVGWYDKNSDKTTHPVGTKQPNELGLYDMSGNTWEWGEDVWHNDYTAAPSDGTAWISDGDQSLRVLRGGSWCNNDILCRSAFRFRNRTDERYDCIGFRVVV